MSTLAVDADFYYFDVYLNIFILTFIGPKQQFARNYNLYNLYI